MFSSLASNFSEFRKLLISIELDILLLANGLLALTSLPYGHRGWVLEAPFISNLLLLQLLETSSLFQFRLLVLRGARWISSGPRMEHVRAVGAAVVALRFKHAPTVAELGRTTPALFIQGRVKLVVEIVPCTHQVVLLEGKLLVAHAVHAPCIRVDIDLGYLIIVASKTHHRFVFLSLGGVASRYIATYLPLHDS